MENNFSHKIFLLRQQLQMLNALILQTDFLWKCFVFERENNSKGKCLFLPLLLFLSRKASQQFLSNKDDRWIFSKSFSIEIW